MKRTIFMLILALLPTVGRMQNHQFVVEDSAAYVVDRYLQLLNINGLPKDSLLVMETAVTMYGSQDTTRMLRWYQREHMMRVEVWERGRQTVGLNTNGKDRFARLDAGVGEWMAVKQDIVLDNMTGYDFRGPLYNWRVLGLQLEWMGRTTVKDSEMMTVKVTDPNRYDRYYFFDPLSGLLTLIFETKEFGGEHFKLNDSHIDWKAIHEYQPLGETLLPSLESFIRNGELTILSTTYRFERRNDDLFNRN